MLAPARVEAACSITTTGVSFGTYDVFQASPVDSTGSVRYQCTGSTGTFTISLGTGSSGTFQPRTMVSGAERLNYNLYLDAARTSIWGDATGGTSWFMESNASGKPVTITVFGRIPPGQDVAAGTYTDTIIVTIQF
jgi:spore coat protein U-like protein